MTVKQEPSGKNETVATADQSTARRLHWNGDLSRDYYIAFELVNIQRKDAGDYGIRFRVDHFPPAILQNWFSLIVQVRGFFFFRQTMERLSGFPPGPKINFAIAFLSKNHMGHQRWRICLHRRRDDVMCMSPYVSNAQISTRIKICIHYFLTFDPI